MGRFRRRQRNRGDKSTKARKASLKDYFTPHELDQVETYLVLYKEKFKNSEHTEQPRTERILPSNKLEYLHVLMKSQYEIPAICTSNATDHIIGDHVFPHLYNISCQSHQQPFLILPASLSKQQRKSIHDLCANMNIFHGSIDLHSISTKKTPKIDVPPSKIDATHNNNAEQEDENESIRNVEHENPVQGCSQNRHCVISLDPKGFEFLYKHGLLNPPIPTPLRKPWYYQQNQPPNTYIMNETQKWEPDQYVLQITNKMKEEITRLTIYPTECIRQASEDKQCDVFDLNMLNGLDLSHNSTTNSSSFLYVDTLSKLQQLSQDLHEIQPTEIAFDLEMYNPSQFNGITCLIQLAFDEKLYVVDVLVIDVWKNLRKYLKEWFENPNVVKIGHAIGGMDVNALHRDYGIFVINAFDTYESAKMLGIQKAGLASLCAHYNLPTSNYYQKLKSKYQRSDWRKRPLTEDMILYGSYDVQYLTMLRKLLIRDLVLSSIDHDTNFTVLNYTNNNESKDENDEDKINFEREQCEQKRQHLYLITPEKLCRIPIIQKAISISQHQCLKFWVHKDEPLNRSQKKASSTYEKILFATKRNMWQEENAQLYYTLLQWRIHVSMREEYIPSSICSTDFLMLVALNCPSNEDELRRLNYFLPEIFQTKSNPKKEKDAPENDYLKELLSIIKVSVERAKAPSNTDSSPSPSPSSPICERKENILSENTHVEHANDKLDPKIDGKNDESSKMKPSFYTFTLVSKMAIIGVLISSCALVISGWKIQKRK